MPEEALTSFTVSKDVEYITSLTVSDVYIANLRIRHKAFSSIFGQA